MAKVSSDDSSFQKGADTAVKLVAAKEIVALSEIADELLRLSQLEVPFDVGFLLQSGNTQRDGGDYLVGYNTPYAARLHEHPEYHFRNGRKGKYLSDPMQRNLSVFRNHFNEAVKEALS